MMCVTNCSLEVWEDCLELELEQEQEQEHQVQTKKR